MAIVWDQSNFYCIIQREYDVTANRWRPDDVSKVPRVGCCPKLLANGCHINRSEIPRYRAKVLYADRLQFLYRPIIMYQRTDEMIDDLLQCDVDIATHPL